MSWDPDAGSSDSEDEETSGFEGFNKREAFIFVIDALLFESEENGFAEALILLREYFLAGILTHSNDLIGVVINNTKHSPNPMDMHGMEDIVVTKNHAVLMPLKTLSKDSIQYFLNFSTPDYFDFPNKYGFEAGSFANTIRLCTTMFQNCKPKPGIETIFYFTDSSTPHKVNSSEYNSALLKANDLRDINIDFNVMPMKKSFAYDHFYKEFLCLAKGVEIDRFVPLDPEQEQKLFKNRQLVTSFQNRCLVHLKWQLGEGCNIGIGYYNYFRKPTSVYPKSITLDPKDNEIIDVKRVVKLNPLAELGESEIENSRYLLPGDEVRMLSIAGKRIPFTADEVAKMKTPISPCLKLLGFIDMSASTDIHSYIKPCAFIYPDEKSVIGSVKLFRALWQKCLEREKNAFCLLVSRRKTTPKFVILEPTCSDLDENIKQSDGFRVTFLPTMDSFRKINFADWESSEPSTEAFEIFKTVVKKLKRNFDPTIISDPSLDELQSKMIGLAFDIQTGGIGESLQPEVDLQDKRIGITEEELNEVFGQDMVQATKRKTKDSSAAAAKKPKLTDDNLNEESIGELIQSNSLTSLTVKQLKTYLQQRGVSGISTLTKPELIGKINALHGV